MNIINNQGDFNRINRQVWGHLFGLFIERGRENESRSLAQAAGLAGIERY